MNMNKSTQPRRGAIAVLAAFCLIMIFAFAAFSIDTGYITIVHQELLSAVDAAALSAAQELRDVPPDGMDQVKTAAIEVAASNTVNGRTLTLDRQSDVEVGIWDPDLGEFVAVDEKDISEANAVRVTGRLSNKRGTQVPLFFAPVINNKSVQMQESAIAVYGFGVPRDVVMVIDCSGSMNQHNRMTYTRPAALALIDELGDDDRLSLAVYSYPRPPGHAAFHGPAAQLFARIAPTGELFLKTAEEKAAEEALKAAKKATKEAEKAAKDAKKSKKSKDKAAKEAAKEAEKEAKEAEKRATDAVKDAAKNPPPPPANPGKGKGPGNQNDKLTGRLERPLNKSFQPVRNRIPQLRPGLYTSRTDIAGGLRVAIEELLNNGRSGDIEKIIVLMTDGRANESEEPGTTPFNSIEHYVDVAAQNDIIIHGITLGFGAEKDPIRDAAENTGGEYHHVEDGDLVKLFEVYRAIGRGTGSKLVR